jgi:hypothetical protein
MHDTHQDVCHKIENLFLDFEEDKAYWEDHKMTELPERVVAVNRTSNKGNMRFTYHINIRYFLRSNTYREEYRTFITELLELLVRSRNEPEFTHEALIVAVRMMDTEGYIGPPTHRMLRLMEHNT